MFILVHRGKRNELNTIAKSATPHLQMNEISKYTKTTMFTGMLTRNTLAQSKHVGKKIGRKIKVSHTKIAILAVNYFTLNKYC